MKQALASYDGREYENITHSPEYAETRDVFREYLAHLPSPLPTSFDDPLWEGRLIRAYRHFTSPGIRKRHLALPKKYEFYDDSF